MKEKDSEKKIKTGKRICFGPFRAWEDGEVTGKAYLNILKRGKLVINLNLNSYDKGRYPWFRKKDLVWESTINIPAVAILQLADEIRSQEGRRRKLSEHKWKRKEFAL